MKDDIREKLLSLDDKNNIEEQEELVVYLMVELRKMMDMVGDSQKYRTLRLYCDWTVHSLADSNTEIIDQAVKDIDRYVGETDQSISVSSSDRPGFLDMKILRDEMRSFLWSGDHDEFTLTFLEDDTRWGRFIETYSRVIDDQPITFRDGPLRSISYEAGEREVEWKFEFSDERRTVILPGKRCSGRNGL